MAGSSALSPIAPVRPSTHAASAAAIATALEARATASSVEPVELTVAVVAPKMTTEEAAKTAPLMVQVGSLDDALPVLRPQRLQREHHRPDPDPQRDRRPARRRVRFLGRRSARSASGPATSSAGRSSAATPSRARRSPAGSARRRRRCSTRRSAAASRSCQRQPHWYYITRYPLGLDATVSRLPDDALPERHQVPDPDPGLCLAGLRPLRDLVGAERPDRVVEPAGRVERRPRCRFGRPDDRAAKPARASGPNGRSTARTSS